MESPSAPHLRGKKSPALRWQEIWRYHLLELFGCAPWFVFRTLLLAADSLTHHCGCDLVRSSMQNERQKWSKPFTGQNTGAKKQQSSEARFPWRCRHLVDNRWVEKSMANACLRLLFSSLCLAWAPKECWARDKHCLLELVLSPLQKALGITI